MASVDCTWNAFLWECTRAPPDDAAVKGYNVYQSDIQLEGFTLPVWIAHHQTHSKKYSSGTLARVFGSPNVYERSVLIVASLIIPATLGPLPGPQPNYFHLLPRFTFSGVVVSAPRTHARNPGCFCFDVGILRRDVFPVVQLHITAWANRDVDRLIIKEKPVIGSSVTINGVFCGWSHRESLMVDIHTLDPNYAGPASPVQIAAPPNPFEHATFASGVPEFPESSAVEAFVDVFSRHAPPTQFTYQRAPPPDPRLRPPTQTRPAIPPIRIPPLRDVLARAAAADRMQVDVDRDTPSSPLGDPAGGGDRPVESAASGAGSRDVAGTTGPVVDGDTAPGVVAGAQNRFGVDGDSRDDESHVADVASSDSGMSDDDAAASIPARVRGKTPVYTHPPIATIESQEPFGNERSSPTATTSAASDVGDVSVQDVRDVYDQACTRARRTGGRATESRAACKRFKAESSAASVIVMA